jgi:imidazolonepropionase-like amidohydrolase
LELDGRAARLELSGTTKSRLKAGITAGEASTTKADVTLAGDAGVFSLDLSPLGIEGTGWFRIEGRAPRAALTFTAPTGAVSSPALRLVEPEKKDEKKALEPAISRRTMPNLAFGWETLPKQETVLVRNATIWTSDAAGVLEGADMLVSNGKIAKIGRGLEAPKGARVVDATGRHVTPGIIDEHSHLAISAGVNEGTHASTAEVRIGDVLNPDDIGLYRALAGGVTAAQLLHGSANPIGGQAQIIRFKWGLGSEGLRFPNAPPSIKFALGENVKQSNWGEEFTTRYPQTRMGVESYIRDRFLAAREYSTEWTSWNALPKDRKAKTSPPRRNLELETLAEILDSKRFIHCHSYVQSEILMLMRLAEDLGFRIETFTHILEGYKLASEMRTHGAGAAGFSDWWAYKAEVWDAIPYSPCITHEKGVVTALNSDSANTIRRLNQEAGKMVMYCGLDQAEALKMVTINPAILLKIDDRVGSLREGKDADFVIWNGNPLSMTTSALQTWIEGANYFDRDRDRELRARDAAEKAALVAKALRSTDKRGGAPPEAAQAETWHCDDLGGFDDAR